MKEDIKSVNIRSIALKRGLLMSHSSVDTFTSFLKEIINNEVIIINTNVGMEVYYYSIIDHSAVIREKVTKYLLNHIEQSKLRYRMHTTGEEVYQSFSEALYTFAQYPQVFLAYSKKFMYLKKKNDNSVRIMPILNTFFEEGLQSLAETGKVPHYQKIQFQKNKSQKSVNNQLVIKELISEILLKMHSN